MGVKEIVCLSYLIYLNILLNKIKSENNKYKNVYFAIQTLSNCLKIIRQTFDKIWNKN